MKNFHYAMITAIITVISVIPNNGIIEHTSIMQKIAFTINIIGLSATVAFLMRSIDLKEWN